MSGIEDATASATLLRQLAEVEERVRALVARRRSKDPDPDDPFRGLYLSDDLVDRLVDQRLPWTSTPPGPGDVVEPETAVATELAAPLRSLVAVGLDALDLDLLLVSVLPDLDPRFERLYGYLNDDVTRRRASVGLAFEISGVSPLSADARGRLSPEGVLLRLGLLVVEEPDRPFLTRALHVPDRVTAHLLGSTACDPALVDVVTDVPAYASDLANGLGAVLSRGTRLVHIRDGEGATALSTAVAALEAMGRPALTLDLDRLGAAPDADDLVVAALRESVLTGFGLAAGPVEALAGRRPATLRRLVSGPAPLALVGHSVWDPQWTDQLPLSVDAPVLAPDQRRRLWRDHLGAVDVAVGTDLEEVALHLALGPGQVAAAVRAARTNALLGGGPMRHEDLRRGVQAQNAAGLGRLATRIEPDVGWDDLVLTPGVSRALREVAGRARHRHTVLTQWRMRRGGGRGNGVTALFAGDSGTGKTMSAEVIAADLSLDLYTVNLASVVDKYIGETEKNLERIFTEAAGVSAVLFFDEADAIFGKRGEVRDAHDRYANIESAYLLQRLESFNGLAVLATNLRANIDDAFTRRLDAVVDFPTPGPELRRRLWEGCLAAPLPLGDDVDLEFCAHSFEMTGGNIRSACTTAAYLAVAAGRPVGMAELVTGVEQEYRKLGRLVLEGEFGEYLELFG